jgi:hypothetical protein
MCYSAGVEDGHAVNIEPLVRRWTLIGQTLLKYRKMGRRRGGEPI